MRSTDKILSREGTVPQRKRNALSERRFRAYSVSDQENIWTSEYTVSVEPPARVARPSRAYSKRSARLQSVSEYVAHTYGWTSAPYPTVIDTSVEQQPPVFQARKVPYISLQTVCHRREVEDRGASSKLGRFQS